MIAGNNHRRISLTHQIMPPLAPLLSLSHLPITPLSLSRLPGSLVSAHLQALHRDRRSQANPARTNAASTPYQRQTSPHQAEEKITCTTANIPTASPRAPLRCPS